MKSLVIFRYPDIRLGEGVPGIVQKRFIRCTARTDSVCRFAVSYPTCQFFLFSLKASWRQLNVFEHVLSEWHLAAYWRLSGSSLHRDQTHC